MCPGVSCSLTRPTAKPCAWHGRLSDFISVNERDCGIALCQHHERCSLEPAGESQKRAWHHSFLVLRGQLCRLQERRPDAASWHIIFEYELPRERGRRPDVVILANRTILVLEFRDYTSVNRAHVDQVAAWWQGQLAAAQYGLANLYYQGRGVRRDLAEAAKWMRLAAEGGDTDAQKDLGILCLRGEGVTEDHVEAYAWFSLADRPGREQLAATLSAKQFRKAERLATRLRAKVAKRIARAQRSRPTPAARWCRCCGCTGKPGRSR